MHGKIKYRHALFYYSYTTDSFYTEGENVTQDSQNDDVINNGPIRTRAPSSQTSADSLETKITEGIEQYGGTFVFVLGVFGNLVSVTVLCRERMRNLPSSFYLLVLSANDLLFIIIAQGLRHFTMYNFGTKDPLIWTSWYCKFFFVTTQTLSGFSNWILAAITAERCIAVCVPLKAKQILRRRNGKIFLTVCFAVILGYYSYAGTLRQVVPKQRGPNIVLMCTIPDSKLDYFVTEVRQWFQVTFATLVPFAIIIPCNICIILTMMRSRSMTSKSNQERSSQQMTALITTLLTVSFAYVLLTAPLRIAFIVQTAYDFRDPLLISIVTFFLHLNHSINFILYMATGSAFRKELRGMLQCCFSGLGRRGEQATSDGERATKISNIDSVSVKNDNSENTV